MRVQTALTARLAALLLQLQAGEVALGHAVINPAECGDKFKCAEEGGRLGKRSRPQFASASRDAVPDCIQPKRTMGRWLIHGGILVGREETVDDTD
jgi:hypothetical protein